MRASLLFRILPLVVPCLLPACTERDEKSFCYTPGVSKYGQVDPITMPSGACLAKSESLVRSFGATQLSVCTFNDPEVTEGPRAGPEGSCCYTLEYDSSQTSCVTGRPLLVVGTARVAEVVWGASWG